MSTRLILALDASLPQEVADSCVELCASFATMLGEPVAVAAVESGAFEELQAWTRARTDDETFATIAPRAAQPATMSAAPFVYKDDGRPDWSAMWGSFCELALYGGPPHRGADNPVEAPGVAEGTDSMVIDDTIMELRRGIFETTGLYSEPAPPSWLAVTCQSRRMAAWMCAAIILENVDAKCDEEILYVPASTDFELKNQVKSVITVVAKVNHYWQAHIGEQEAREASASA